MKLLLDISGYSPKAADRIREMVAEFTAGLPDRVVCQAKLSDWVPAAKPPMKGKK